MQRRSIASRESNALARSEDGFRRLGSTRSSWAVDSVGHAARTCHDGTRAGEKLALFGGGVRLTGTPAGGGRRAAGFRALAGAVRRSRAA